MKKAFVFTAILFLLGINSGFGSPNSRGKASKVLPSDSSKRKNDTTKRIACFFDGKRVSADSAQSLIRRTIRGEIRGVGFNDARNSIKYFGAKYRDGIYVFESDKNKKK